MKINNKGYASTIIMFSILTLFLISMLMLVKTMNNSSSLNKKITEKVVDNILLKEVLGKLEKRERQIIMLRYFEDKTQSEIGEILKISQVQVSRIEKKVLLKLKSYIS